MASDSSKLYYYLNHQTSTMRWRFLRRTANHPPKENLEEQHQMDTKTNRGRLQVARKSYFIKKTHRNNTRYFLGAQKPSAYLFGCIWHNMDLKHISRGRKTSSSYRYCRPESFCTFGNFLHVTLCALGSFLTIWKVSRLSGKFPDDLESLWMVWIFSGWSGKFPDNLKNFRIDWKVSGWSGKFLDSLESFQVAWKVSG